MYHYHDPSDQTATGQWNEILAAWEEASDIELDIEYQTNEPYLSGHEDEFALAALTQQGPKGEIYELPQKITACHVIFFQYPADGRTGPDLPQDHGRAPGPGREDQGGRP